MAARGQLLCQESHTPQPHPHIPPVMGGHLIGAGAERGQVTRSQLHLQDLREASSQCRLWWRSSPVLGLEVSLGLGWGVWIQSGPFTLLLQGKGTGTPKCRGLESQLSRDLPNLTPFYATLSEPFSPGPGGARRSQEKGRGVPQAPLHCWPL